MVHSMDIEKIREDFPILKREVNGKKLAYLDNTATTQKPKQVLDAIRNYYEQSNANVHRGVHQLSQEASDMHDAARKKAADFIGAKQKEIIFTRNATEGVNLVRYAWGNANINTGDRIVVTEMEHHSNLVPWQLLSKEKKAKLEFIRITKDGLLDMDDAKKKIEGAKLVAFTHMSNVLGTITDARHIVRMAHDAGAITVVDAAQSVPHLKVNVKEMDADFLAFSGHKMLGPMGIGVLYGKKELLEEMQPFLAGGDMIKEVHREDAIWNDVPHKFEAGTPDVAAAVGLAAAIDYLNEIGMDNVRKHEHELTAYALEKLSEIKDINVYGPRSADQKGGVIAFNLNGVHSHDVAGILNDDGIAIRSGHHCAMPLLEKLGVCDACRASFYVYNTREEIDCLVDGLKKVRSVFQLDNTKSNEKMIAK